MADFYEYNPQRVNITWGAILFRGFADGVMVRAEYNEDGVMLTVGTKGDHTATINENRSGRFTLNLQQGSPVNGLLSLQAASNRPRGSSLIVKPFIIADLNGTTLIEAPRAWITKVPAGAFGKEHEAREWIFETGDLICHVGGNVT